VNKKTVTIICLILFALILSVSASARGNEPLEFDRGEIAFAVNTSQEGTTQTTAPAALTVSANAPNACAAGCSMASSVESLDGFPFCVYYDSGDTTLAQAEAVRNDVDDYWDVYVNDFGWPAPEFTTNFKVCLEDHGTTCDGSVGIGNDYMTVYEGCDSTQAMRMAVSGHELAHAGPQLGPLSITSPNFDELWAHEGTARSGEDKVFAIVDNNPNAMTQPFSYNREVDEFFANPNHDLTSDSWRYESAIWWTYYAEQCGTFPAGEPGLGVADSFGEFWDAAQTSDGIAALNIALGTLGCDPFNTMIKKFVLANYTKDLSGLPDASYYYIDETEPGNPDTYGPLVPNDGGTIETGTPATWNNQPISRYGADYYVASPDAADCPVITAEFHADSGSPFYHIVTSNGGAFNTHVQGSGTDWVRSFLNDGVTEIAAVVGSLGSSSQADVELSCSDPILDIMQPNQMAPEYVGGHADGDKFLVQVVVSTTVGGPVVGGLTTSDFQVRVGAHLATIVGGGQIEHQYFLQVIAPDPGTNGQYDLHVDLEESGTSTTIASDTEIQAVVYDATNEDNVYVVDRSGSMGWYDPTPWEALVDAVHLAVDTTNFSEGIAVVAFGHDVSPTPFSMQFATLPVRAAAKTYIDGISPGGGTSIGDGMGEGASQITGSATGNTRCRIVLLSDGQENQPDYWADVSAAVQATGCPVMTIAFGPGANETLMQQIAAATGGSYYYSDVYMGTSRGVSSFTAADMVLDLGSVYQFAQASGERQRLLTEKGQVSLRQTISHTVQIDPSILEADFILDWYAPYYPVMSLALVQPDGGVISDTYDFADLAAGHVGWRIPNPDDGEWTLVVELLQSRVKLVDYQVMVTGKTLFTARLILPDTLSRQFLTGARVPIRALVTTGLGPEGLALVMADVTAPDGLTSTIPLQHTGGGMYLGHFTLGNQADPSSPPAEDGNPDPTPNDEGSYRVQLRVDGEGGLHRETLGAFSILEAEDGNSNGLPDTWEDEHGVTSPSGDPDGDLLNNFDEYYSGTDPNNSDTDGGGENDGSEVSLHGSDPLDPADDEIEAPEFFQSQAVLGGAVRLAYDVKAEYAKMSLYRSSSPWQLIVSELPLTGVYTDTTVVLENSYAYRLVGIDSANHWSAVLGSDVITSSLDPIPPEALVIVNGGVLTTTELSVVLTFTPIPDDWADEAFDDIAEMKLSNDLGFAGASWQSFAQDAPWTLSASPGEIAQVYVLFKDTSDNESVGPTIGSIFYEPFVIYAPIVIK